MVKETLHFKTNTLLKNLVGKDLINQDSIAIVELVKNSYDADSEDVILKFTNFSENEISTENSQLIIADQGSGMDLDDIKDKWLNIAYSEKKYIERGTGAYLAGNKGIGRFSCDRLGKELDLLTRVKNGDILHMHITWADFEVEGKKDLTIQKIPLIIQSITLQEANQLTGFEKFPEHGTILVISYLRNTWDRDSLLDLKISLEKFLNPNQLFEKNKFRISIEAPDLDDKEKNKPYNERVTGVVENQIFEKLKFKATYIEADISENGQEIITSLWHEGEKVFDLVEKNELYLLIPGTYIVIYYLNPYKKAYFKRQTGVRSVDFGSVFLFLNGFRIAPYGDRGDDWLGLDVRKTQGTMRYLSSRDIVGRIEISGSEDKFKPISSREGLKETKEFIQLKDKFFLDILRKLEKFVVDGLQWDSVPDTIRQELRKEEGFDWDSTHEEYKESWDLKKQRITTSLMALIGTTSSRLDKFWFNPSLLEGVYETRQDEVKKLLSDIEGINPESIDSNLTNSLSNIKKLIEQKESEALEARKEAASLRVEIVEKETKITELEDQTETYRAQTLFLQQVSSLDVQQLLTYHHQIIIDSEIVDNYIKRVLNSLREMPNAKPIVENLQKASLANKRVASIAQYATKANFRSGTKKQKTDLPAFITQYLLNVASDFIASDIKLEVKNEVSELFELDVSRVEVTILVDNIISNAKKAMAKELFVTLSLISANVLRISFIDNGKGLSQELPSVDAMFEAGVTTTSGSGLGLFHARNIVKKFNGKITAIPIIPKGMEIRVEVTR